MPNPKPISITEHKTIIHRIVYRLSKTDQLTQQQIAEAVGYSQTNISTIISKVAQEESCEDYSVTKPRGSRCRLTASELQELKRRLDEGAKANGFKTAGWTRHRVHGLVKYLFDQDYSLVQIGRLLAKLNYTIQKVSVRDTRRRGDQTIYYEEQTLPVLKKN